MTIEALDATSALFVKMTLANANSNAAVAVEMLDQMLAQYQVSDHRENMIAARAFLAQAAK